MIDTCVTTDILLRANPRKSPAQPHLPLVKMNAQHSEETILLKERLVHPHVLQDLMGW